MNEKKQIQLEVEIGNIGTMADGGNKISLYTGELNPESSTQLFAFKKLGTCFMVLAEARVEKLEIPEVIMEKEGEKTPSQRLRAVLYRLWEAKGKPGSGFPVFYETHLEKIIQQYKELLPPN